MRTIAFVLMLSAAAGFSSSVFAIDIEIVYEDGLNEGFNDVAFGALRREAFERAVDIWASKISDSVEIRLSAQFNSESESEELQNGLLAVGSAVTFKANLAGLASGVFYPSALASQLHGSSLPGDENSDFPGFHLFIIFNSDIDEQSTGFFSYFLEPPINPGEIDFIEVAIHEIAHGLGFVRTFSSTTGAFVAGIPDIYSIQLTETGPTLDIDVVDMIDAQRMFTLERDFLYWKGPQVVGFGLPGSGMEGGAVNQKGEVKMYAPSIVESPPDLSPVTRGNHFDEDHSGPLLMQPFPISGIRELDVTREALIDIGWNFHPRSGPLAWVDFTSPTLGNGTFDEPFSRLIDAVNFVSAGGTIRIMSSVSGEMLTIDKPMTIETFGGPSSVGL